MASAWVMDSAATGFSASPLTGEIEITCHVPVFPPRNVVNMGYVTAEPGGVQVHRVRRPRVPTVAEKGNDAFSQMMIAEEYGIFYLGL
jgi:hypothetical protein